MPSPTEELLSVETVRDVRIPVPRREGTLSGDLYRPVTTERVPVLVTVLPYRKDMPGDPIEEALRWFAARGYAGLLVDIWGTGSSDGVRFPELDPADADDAIASIEWATAQDWCDGTAGMWGVSYGAVVTMRTASHRPPALKAIIPLEHGLRAETDTIHPGGARGDLHALVSRGISMLVQQMAPPFYDHTSPDEQRRWRLRMAETEPVFLDFAQHPAGHPVWDERAIDGGAITAPALCIGGWRDGFPGPLIDAYLRLSGPKRLVMGPWGHLLPHRSHFGPIDFLQLALGWWDRWLRDVPGATAESGALIHIEGTDPGWRDYPAWPPVGDEVVLTTGAGPALAPPTGAEPTDVIATYIPDATIGTARGLPGLAMGELCPPQDQHPDDLRAMTADGPPLAADLLLVGQPAVTVRLADGHIPVTRIAVRMSHVDSQGRSTLISHGATPTRDKGPTHHVQLAPIAYRVPAGNRLRIAVSDADFPRLRPLPFPQEMRIAAVTLTLPRVPADAGTPTAVKALDPVPLPPGRWTVARDHVTDAVEVSVTSSSAGIATAQGHQLASTKELRASVPPHDPRAAVFSGRHVQTASLTTGETVVTSAQVRTTHASLWARAEVTIDGLVILDRTWNADLQPEA